MSYQLDPSGTRDPNDYEVLQAAALPEFEPIEGGGIDSVFDPSFSQVTHSDMYRAWVFPELFPDEPQPRLENWDAEDLEAFCGIYR